MINYFESGLVRHQWLTLATWKTEIRRIVVQGKSRKIVHETPSPK
jgi:hypothetical protein